MFIIGDLLVVFSVLSFIGNVSSSRKSYEIEVRCLEDRFEVQAFFHAEFEGVIYPRNLPNKSGPCYSMYDGSSKNVTYTLPFNDCNTSSVFHNDKLVFVNTLRITPYPLYRIPLYTYYGELVDVRCIYKRKNGVNGTAEGDEKAVQNAPPNTLSPTPEPAESPESDHGLSPPTTAMPVPDHSLSPETSATPVLDHRPNNVTPPPESAASPDSDLGYSKAQLVKGVGPKATLTVIKVENDEIFPADHVKSGDNLVIDIQMKKGDTYGLLVGKCYAEDEQDTMLLTDDKGCSLNLQVIEDFSYAKDFSSARAHVKSLKSQHNQLFIKCETRTCLKDFNHCKVPVCQGKDTL